MGILPTRVTDRHMWWQSKSCQRETCKGIDVNGRAGDIATRHEWEMVIPGHGLEEHPVKQTGSTNGLPKIPEPKNKKIEV
jgi:hypothetical protein